MHASIRLNVLSLGRFYLSYFFHYCKDDFKEVDDEENGITEPESKMTAFILSIYCKTEHVKTVTVIN